MSPRTSPPRHLVGLGCSPARLRRALRSLARLSSLLLLGQLVQVGPAEAQFNAKGRRQRSPSTEQRRPTDPRAPTQKPSAKGPTEPATPHAAPEAQPDTREEELISRYQKLIIDQPGEEVPIKRLAELVRKRDGHIDQLLAQLKASLSTGSRAEKYGAGLCLGLLLAEQNALAEALSVVKQTVQFHPEKRAGHQLQGDIELRLGDKAAAISSFEAALAVSVEPDRSLLLRTLRQLALDLDKLDEAKNYHARLTQGARGNSYLVGELGRELLLRGRTQEAIVELRRVAEQQRDDVRAYGPALLDLGEAELGGGEHAAAIKHLTLASQLLKSSPGKQLIAQRKLAEVHQARGDLNAYLKELEQAAENAQSLELLGALYEQEGATQKALAAYRRASNLSPQDLDLKLRVARLLELLGDLPGAVAAQKQATASAPADVQLSFRLMNLLLAEGRRDQVLVEWDRIFSRAKSDAEACLLLADFAERLEERERQEKALSHVAGQVSGNYRVLVDLGSRYFRKGDTQRARKIWDKIPSTVSDRARGQVILGEVLIDHEAFEEGLALLSAAHQLDPSSPSVTRALALGAERAAAQASGRKAKDWQDQAIVQYERLLHLPGSDAERTLARRHLVRLWKRRGDLALRIEKLKIHLTEHPGDRDTLRLLSVAQEKIGDLASATATLDSYCLAHPGDVDALKELSQMQLRLGQTSAAMKTWQRLIAADPARRREYYGAMSSAAKQSGDLDEALRYAEQAASQQTNDPTAFSLLGELYQERGQFEKAQAAFLRALAEDETLDGVRLQLAELLVLSGQSRAAFDHLSHVVRHSKDDAAILRAGSRLLNVGLTTGTLPEVESTFRRLAVARPESDSYRKLFFDVLAAEVDPLELKLHHGTAQQSQQARMDLKLLAQRSTSVLLSALSSEVPGDQSTALRLLAHDTTSSTHMALLAFAEGNHPLPHRVSALLAITNPNHPEIVTRLVRLVLAKEQPESDLAVAAIYALRHNAPAGFELLPQLAQDSSSRLGHVFLALSHNPSLSRTQVGQLLHRFIEDAQYESASRPLRFATLLGLTVLLSRASDHAAVASDQLLEIAVAAARSDDPDLAQTGLLLLHPLPSSELRRRTLAQALLARDSERRQVARHVLTARSTSRSDSLLVEDHEPFVDDHEQQRPTPSELQLDLYTKQLKERMIADLSRGPKAALPDELEADLLAVARELLATANQDASEVLNQLNEGGVLSGMRDELKDDLLAVSEAQGKLASLALLHLRATDSLAAQLQLKQALGSRLTRDDALLALSLHPSLKSAEVLLAYETSLPTLNWSDRRKLLEAWNRYLSSDDETLRALAQPALLRLERHAPPTQSGPTPDQRR